MAGGRGGFVQNPQATSTQQQKPGQRACCDKAGGIEKANASEDTTTPEQAVAMAQTARPVMIPDAAKAFNTWTDRYLKASTEDRKAMVPEGVRIAEARRPEFKRLIQESPQKALAAAVPMVVRQQLPPSVVSRLEERVSGRAVLRVYQSTPEPVKAAEKETAKAPIVAPQPSVARVPRVAGAVAAASGCTQTASSSWLMRLATPLD